MMVGMEVGDLARTRYASALSENPSAVGAVGEVSGLVLEEVGPAPDLAVLFVTPPHVDALDDIVGVVRSVVQPRTLLGAAAVAVGPGGRRDRGLQQPGDRRRVDGDAIDALGHDCAAVFGLPGWPGEAGDDAFAVFAVQVARGATSP